MKTFHFTGSAARRLCGLISFFFWIQLAALEAGTSVKDVRYIEDKPGADAYRLERAVLDIHAPTHAAQVPVVVWFHGGGLTEGNKTWMPETLRGVDLIVVSPSYRLIPRATPEQVLQDAAAAVAWTFRNIDRHGGDTSRIFLSGHSAGAYLSTMLVLDPKWLAAERIDSSRIAGLIPFSAQMVSHSSVRKRVSPSETEAYAPLHHARVDAPPILLLVGDREKDLPGRYDENARMLRRLTELGHDQVELVEFPGTDHVSMQEPGIGRLLPFISRIAARPYPAR